MDRGPKDSICNTNQREKIGSLQLHVAYCACYHLEYRI